MPIKPRSLDKDPNWGHSPRWGESIAITLKTDPTVDPEAACVALQIGMNLMMNAVTVDGASVDVEPAREVRLFPTLAGVELVNPSNDFSNAQCTTQSGPTSLSDILTSFVNMGGEVVVCGLCAMERGISNPTQGEIGNAQQIHNLFIHADKVLDF